MPFHPALADIGVAGDILRIYVLENGASDVTVSD